MSIDDQELFDYLAIRAAQREQDIDERLAQLTPRERSLIRDTAVMGYVLGYMDGKVGIEFPKDTPIMRAVVYAALREDTNYAVLRGEADAYIEQMNRKD